MFFIFLLLIIPAVSREMTLFYHPECPFSKSLLNGWKDIENENISKVNCVDESFLCARHEIVGYPTIKYKILREWFIYKEPRNITTMKNFAAFYINNGCAEDKSLCTEEENYEIQQYAQMETPDLLKLQETRNKEYIELHGTYEEELFSLRKQYESLYAEKNLKLTKLIKKHSVLNDFIQSINT